MRRRTVLTTGATIAVGAIAGCTGDDDGDGDAESTPTPTPTSTPTAESGGESAGDVSFAVESSATEIDWGEEYSVTVTVQAGDESQQVGTAIVYQTPEDSTWSGSFGTTEKVWRLDAGESQTETFEPEPPALGELRVGLFNFVEEEVLEEWELTVNPPVQSFGEALSYYDGLEATVDVELHEWLEFELSRETGDETGTYSVRPADGQWVKVSIVAENTNTNSDVGIPGYDAFSALASNSQLDHPRYLGEDVGAGTGYEVDDQTRHEEGAWLEMNDGGEPGQEGFWLPQADLVPGAVEAGWVVFETDADTTKADLQIQLERSDVRATWE